VNAFAIALDSIWRHRLRSTLTALGVVIGVFAVVTLTSLGTSVKAYVTGQFSKVGATLITVAPANPGSASQKHRFGGGGIGTAPSTLTVADANAILARHSPSIASVSPVADIPVTIGTTPGGSSGLPITGVSASYFTMEQLPFAHGRFSGTGVVLGHSAASILFPHTKNPVGDTVYIGQQAFTVSGLLQKGSGIAALESDHMVFMPVAAGLKLAGLTTVADIVVNASSPSNVNAAANLVTRIMASRHPSKNFAVTKATQLLSTITSTLSTITTFLAGLAAISLLVGGIGIMNIMLVTVTERFKEIGIRKAMGARDSDVLVQFVAESILLALLGGAVGVGLSAIASGIVARLAGFPGGLTLGAVVLALVFSILVGGVFGVLPAMRAARLMPVDALRTE
jgi:putative ABC transport system permease protein